LLSVVEALSADKKSLADGVERLRKQLERKKKAKTTSNSDKDDQADNQDSDSDYSPACAAPEFKTLLDDWFGERNQQLRTAIEHASAIVYYRHQS